MRGFLHLLVAVFCYTAFFVSFVYLVGFVGASPVLPTHVDKGMQAPLVSALVIDLLLIALFGIQHSVMARKGFKAAWMKVVPAPIERSTYCLATALALGALFLFWHPVGGSVWSITDPALRGVVWALFWLGWGILFIATFLISHFELFGLAQAWRSFRGIAPKPAQFRTPLFYRYVRHPIYTGILLGFWATPDMTGSHLLLAAGFTIYILIGIRYEERDLVESFGDAYVTYRRYVGMVIPGIGKRG